MDNLCSDIDKNEQSYVTKTTFHKTKDPLTGRTVLDGSYKGTYCRTLSINGGRGIIVGLNKAKKLLSVKRHMILTKMLNTGNRFHYILLRYLKRQMRPLIRLFLHRKETKLLKFKSKFGFFFFFTLLIP